MKRGIARLAKASPAGAVDGGQEPGDAAGADGGSQA
jgi:hypothetical protein